MKHLLALSIFSLVLFSCKKSTPPEPAKSQFYVLTPSQTGENVLVFKIGDATHIYSGTPTYFNDNGVKYSLAVSKGVSEGIVIYADNTNYNDGLMLFANINDESQPPNTPIIGKKYHLSTNTHFHSFYYTGQGNDDETYNSNDSLSTITFTRFDDKVIAGTFEFHSKTNNGKEIDLLDGFFDIPR